MCGKLISLLVKMEQLINQLKSESNVLSLEWLDKKMDECLNELAQLDLEKRKHVEKNAIVICESMQIQKELEKQISDCLFLCRQSRIDKEPCLKRFKIIQLFTRKQNLLSCLNHLDKKFFK